MIISVNELKSRIDCGEIDIDTIKSRLDAIEDVIRAYTNNNFQNRNVRFVASSSNGNQLNAVSPFLRVDDTIQISQSKVNDGLYRITDISGGCITVDGSLYDVSYNKVTKIEYPSAVAQCAVDLFKWQIEYGSKIGIKSESETLSRHSESVTYEDSTTLFMGYPTGILSGLTLYKKARC